MATSTQSVKTPSKSNKAASNSRQTRAENQSATIVDKRPATLAQRNIIATMGSGSGAQRTAQLQAIMGGTAPVQRVKEDKTQIKDTSIENNTGLPDQLKSGIENISGISLNDVRVHPNSSQPGELSAHAFAQGTDIHLAPGQEKHLPHEAWHVVQQKQGRVQPTKQVGDGVNVNDHPGLEREATQMGQRALNHISQTDTPSIQSAPTPSATAQLWSWSRNKKDEKGKDTGINDEGREKKPGFTKGLLGGALGWGLGAVGGALGGLGGAAYGAYKGATGSGDTKEDGTGKKGWFDQMKASGKSGAVGGVKAGYETGKTAGDLIVEAPKLAVGAVGGALGGLGGAAYGAVKGAAGYGDKNEDGKKKGWYDQMKASGKSGAKGGAKAGYATMDKIQNVADEAPGLAIDVLRGSLGAAGGALGGLGGAAYGAVKGAAGYGDKNEDGKKKGWYDQMKASGKSGAKGGAKAGYATMDKIQNVADEAPGLAIDVLRGSLGAAGGALGGLGGAAYGAVKGAAGYGDKNEDGKKKGWFDQMKASGESGAKGGFNALANSERAEWAMRKGAGVAGGIAGGAVGALAGPGGALAGGAAGAAMAAGGIGAYFGDEEKDYEQSAAIAGISSLAGAGLGAAVSGAGGFGSLAEEGSKVLAPKLSAETSIANAGLLPHIGHHAGGFLAQAGASLSNAMIGGAATQGIDTARNGGSVTDVLKDSALGLDLTGTLMGDGVTTEVGDKKRERDGSGSIKGQEANTKKQLPNLISSNKDKGYQEKRKKNSVGNKFRDRMSRVFSW